MCRNIRKSSNWIEDKPARNSFTLVTFRTISGPADILKVFDNEKGYENALG
jgi:hypothetical protein